MTWRPEQAFVIHLARRGDRAAHVRDLEARVPGLQVVDGVDGAEPADRGHWRSSAGAWGNRQSHLGVLRACIGSSSVLVLEDDAVVPEDFMDRLSELVEQAPAGWEVLMLGGEHVRPPTFVAPGLVRCNRTIRTHAYVVQAPAIAMVAEVAQNARRHWDHGLCRVLGLRGRTYAPDPFLVGVAPSASDIADSAQLRVNYRYF